MEQNHSSLKELTVCTHYSKDNDRWTLWEVDSCCQWTQNYQVATTRFLFSRLSTTPRSQETDHWLHSCLTSLVKLPRLSVYIIYFAMIIFVFNMFVIIRAATTLYVHVLIILLLQNNNICSINKRRSPTRLKYAWGVSLSFWVYRCCMGAYFLCADRSTVPPAECHTSIITHSKLIVHH